MSKANAPFYSFNRGIVSKRALGRIDIERLRLSAETQTNWVPRTLGPMSLRAGLGYVAPTRANAACMVIPFVFSAAQTAALELTDSNMRVLVDDVVVTRPAVSTVMSNVSVPAAWYVRTSGSGVVSLTGGVAVLRKGSIGGVAKITQTVGVIPADFGKEHALTIWIGHGGARLRVGSALDGENYIAPTQLGEGWHSLAFTPTAGSVYVEFEALYIYDMTIYSCAISTGGDMLVTTPWLESNLDDIRYEQSADVVFVACRGVKQMRIERRSQRSWSVVDFKSSVGPFTSNISTTLTMAPTGLLGNQYVLSNEPIFKPGHAGALLKLTHSGQQSSANISAQNTFTDPIKVAGVGSTRSFAVYTSGTWSGTLTLQRSFDGPDSGYLDFKSYTTATADTISDGLDNSIIWYRIGFKTAAYSSGTASPTLVYASGSGSGVARIVSYQSPTQVYVEVLDNFSNTTATTDWKLGSWNSYNGWPTAVRLFEGRLWWAGNDRFWGSASDEYDNFDVSAEGDGAAIDRTIGAGPISVINWLTGTQRLMAGTDMAVIQAKSSSLDEPLTPTAFSLKPVANQGTAPLAALAVDSRIVFAEQGGRRVYQILFDITSNDYVVSDLTRLNDEFGLVGFRDIALQRQPDTMLHFPTGDGASMVLLYDADDKVEAWWRVETDGFIERAYVLPGDLESRVYYVVRRTIGGVTKRYHERFSRMDECKGGTLNKQADSFIVSTGVARTTVTGLGHLEGKQVVVWADGKDQGVATVAGGAITLLNPVTNAIVGLGYSATFKSAKLAYAAQAGTAVNQTKRVDHLGVVLDNTHAKGLIYGDSTGKTWPMPNIENGVPVDPDAIWDQYDMQMLPLPGRWDTDSRLLLLAAAPRPCTVVAAVIGLTTIG